MNNQELLDSLRQELYKTRSQPELTLIISESMADLLVEENVITDDEADLGRETYSHLKINPKKALFDSLIDVFGKQTSLVVDPNSNNDFTVLGT